MKQRCVYNNILAMENNLTHTTAKEHSLPSVRDSVLARIEEERICPRSRWFFQGRECVVWALWLISIVLGALALAVIFYVGLYIHYAPYEATHQNWLTFIFSALPYLWLGVFMAMAYLAVTELRRTKRGYRYRTAQVLGSSVLLSLLGGLVLHASGLGYALDDALGKQVSTYTSMEKAELKRWQTPDAGRLLGKVESVSVVTANSSPIIFTDRLQKQWALDVSELTSDEVKLLRNNELVRLLGINEGGSNFYACAVLPWHYSGRLSHDDFVAARVRFTERMLAHKYNNQARRESYEDTDDQDLATRRCPTMPMMKRI